MYHRTHVKRTPHWHECVHTVVQLTPPSRTYHLLSLTHCPLKTKLPASAPTVHFLCHSNHSGGHMQVESDSTCCFVMVLLYSA